MDVDAKATRDDSLNRLQQQVRSGEPGFFSPDDLRIFGIQASQIDMTEDGRLQFDPCFFHPHPEKVLEKYPLDPLLMDGGITPLNCRPDYDAILEEFSEVFSDSEKAIKCATERYNLERQMYDEDWLAQASQTSEHISWQIKEEDRMGLSTSLFNSDLVPSRKIRRDACDHPLVRPGRDKGPHWDVLEIWTGYVEDVQSSLMPHAIISVASDVSADDADTSLTSCELSAIVNFIMCRKSCGPSRKHPVHPVLFLSYTGRNHGRIIQASHDWQGLTLQYSPLWSFEDDEMAPVELFVRYMMSEFVGLETSPIVGPMARLDIN